MGVKKQKITFPVSGIKFLADYYSVVGIRIAHENRLSSEIAAGRGLINIGYRIAVPVSVGQLIEKLPAVASGGRNA